MKNTTHVFIISFLFQQIFFLTSSKRTCTKNDIGIFVGECHQNREREIFFYWKNYDCNPDSAITIPSSIVSRECDFICEPGYHIGYNFKENKLICQKCPKGTYSTGGKRSINEWNEAILGEFINNCFIIINDEIKSNESCEKFKINNNGTVTSIIAGPGDKIKEAMYSYELIYNLHIARSGNVFFKYKKDTLTDYKYINGQVNFYVDYDLKLHDDKTDDDIKDFSIKLDKGHHSLMWQYNVWAIPDDKLNKKIEFQLFSIDFEGLHNLYQCVACDEFSNQYSSCNECQENHYYDMENKLCMSCADDEYALNVNNKIDCIKQPVCNDDFVIEEHTGRCDSNYMDEIVYQYDGKFCLKGIPEKDETQDSSSDNVDDKENFPSLPKENSNKTNPFDWKFPSSRKEKCKPCNEGYLQVFEDYVHICKACRRNSYLDEKQNICLECPKETDVVKKLIITGHSVHARESFESNICYNIINDGLVENKACPGWVFRSHGIHSGMRVPSNTQKVVTKIVKIEANNGKLYVNFTIHGLEQEEFIIKVNSNETIYSDYPKQTNKNISLEFTLEKGENQISFIFNNKNSNTSQFNMQENQYSVILRSIVIIGSNEGAGISCSDCPEDTVIKNLNGKILCSSCEKGQLPNKDKTQCIDCQASDSSANCLICPVFTNGSKSEDCNLKTSIHNKKALIKYNLKEFSKQINSECEDQNEICYSTFLGPIRDHSSGDLYFISYAKRNLINILDFTYKQSERFIDTGHVFALIHSNTEIKNNHTENFKLLKNVGNYISDVKLIASPDDQLMKEIMNKNKTQIFKKSGIMIEYGLGEYCLEKQRYKSYLFLFCDKSSNNHAPRLVKKSENGCTLYFEMHSKSLCPLCVKSQINIQATSCVNNTQYLFFNENDSCIISTNYEKDNEEGKYYSELDNILTLNDTINDPDLKYYFEIDEMNNDYSDEPTYITISDDKLTLADEEFYAVTGVTDKKKCSMIDNFDSSFVSLFIFILPLLYFAVGICVVVFYCKYKRATNAYERLREGRSAERSNNNHSISIETN